MRLVAVASAVFLSGRVSDMAEVSTPTRNGRRSRNTGRSTCWLRIAAWWKVTGALVASPAVVEGAAGAIDLPKLAALK